MYTIFVPSAKLYLSDVYLTVAVAGPRSMADKPSMTEALTVELHTASEWLVRGIFAFVVFLFALGFAAAGAFVMWKMLAGVDISEGVPWQIAFVFLPAAFFVGGLYGMFRVVRNVVDAIRTRFGGEAVSLSGSKPDVSRG